MTDSTTSDLSENLKEYLGKVVAVTFQNKTTFGVLQTNGEIFGVNGNGFPVEMVKAINKIEVEESKNLARCNIELEKQAN